MVISYEVKVGINNKVLRDFFQRILDKAYLDLNMLNVEGQISPVKDTLKNVPRDFIAAPSFYRMNFCLKKREKNRLLGMILILFHTGYFR